MTDIDINDITAMRRQGDLGSYLRQAVATEAAANADRKRLVYRHPDLIERLQVLGQHPWNGRIPPEEWGGTTNRSPIRAELLAIVAEAEQRTTPRSAA